MPGEVGRLSESQHTAEVCFSLPNVITLITFFKCSEASKHCDYCTCSEIMQSCLSCNAQKHKLLCSAESFNFSLDSLLSRDATNKLFRSVVQQRRTEIQANPKISQSLLAFQR